MLEVTMTCTLRPDIIRRTLKSFLMYAVNDEVFNFLVNIDNAGPGRNEDVVAVFDEEVSIGPHAVDFLKSENKGFNSAVENLFNAVQGRVFFNLQDDWVFSDPFFLTPVCEIFNSIENFAHVCFRQKKVPEGTCIHFVDGLSITLRRKRPGKTYLPMGPGIWSSKLAKWVVRHADMDSEISIEKQMYRIKFIDKEVSKWLVCDYGRPGFGPISFDIGREWAKKHGIKKEKGIIHWK